VNGGHLGNMLIRILWYIFSAGNILFSKVDVLWVLNIVLKFSSCGDAWEPVLTVKF
jgi:hypothetical protein